MSPILPNVPLRGESLLPHAVENCRFRHPVSCNVSVLAFQEYLKNAAAAHEFFAVIIVSDPQNIHKMPAALYIINQMKGSVVYLGLKEHFVALIHKTSFSS